jgi:hypothetical protein
MPREKYQKRHYWMMISQLIQLPPEEREQKVEELIGMYTRDNPRFRPDVFRNALEKAIEDPSIIPDIKGGQKAPMANKYDPNYNPVGSRGGQPRRKPDFDAETVNEIVKRTVLETIKVLLS